MTGKDLVFAVNPGLGQLPSMNQTSMGNCQQLAQWTHGTWKVSRMLVTCWRR